MKNNQRTWTLVKMTLGIAACGLGAATVQADEPPPFYYYSVGLDAGTPGVGGSASWRFSNHFGVRAGVDYLKFGHDGTVKDIDYNGHMQLASEPLTLDWYPSSTSSFHVSAGVAFNENKLTGTGDASQTVTINGHTYAPGELGTVDLEIKQRLVNGYLSIGGNLFYFDHMHHWAMTGELGAMYGGKPSVSLSQTGGDPLLKGQINSDLATEQQKIQHYANDVPFWPVAKLGVNFSF